MNKYESPTVSVVMSVYNGEKYLCKAVESILNQSFRNFEFIIIDDGSTDQSKVILEQYAAQDARIRLVCRENRGLTKSLNEGTALAQGEFIARMDADDVSHHNRLRRQIEFMREHKECLCAGTWAVCIDSNDFPLFEKRPPTDHEKIDSAHFIGAGGVLIHSSVILRAALIKKIGGYNEHFFYAQDYDLWLRIAEIGKIANLPQCLLKYRIHDSAISQVETGDQREAVTAILESAIKRRQSAGVAIPLALPYNPNRWPYNATDDFAIIKNAWKHGFPITSFHRGMNYFLDPRNRQRVLKKLLNFGFSVSMWQ